MKLKTLKKGTWFTLKDIQIPKASQVWVRGEYSREYKAYYCSKWDDISSSRLIKGDREVFVDFIF